MTQIDIYTDGACSGNPGPGGWAAVLLHGERRLEISGYVPATTNNRMELTAVIEALRRLKKTCLRIRVYSDSTYVCKAFNEGWVHRWQAAGWRRKDQAIPNADLWRDLLIVAHGHEITWIWVRGHAENPENNRCDAMAREAVRAASCGERALDIGTTL